MAAPLVIVFLACTVTSLCHGLDDWDQYNQVWQDEFDSFDSSKWGYDVTATGGGNSEFQLYTADGANSWVANGFLYIKPTLLADTNNPQTSQPYGDDFMKNGVLDVTKIYGSCTNSDNGGCYRTGADGNIPPVMSAKLMTSQKYSFTFGRAVISAKMPVGDWLWPAIWMLPEDWVYGSWPRSGEIDIIESIGNRDLKQGTDDIGIQKMGTTLHWGPDPGQNRWSKTHLTKTDEASNYGDNFHKFIFDWSPNGLRFYIDDEDNPLLDVPYPLIDANPGWTGFWEWGQPWTTSDNPWAGGSNLAPFDKAFYFILNVAVGGTNGFIPDGATNQGGDAAQQKPWGNGDGYVPSMQKFYDARDNWKPTWDKEGDNNAMQVDYIRVFQKK